MSSEPDAREPPSFTSCSRQDPRHRVARTWELLHPCPPPQRTTYETDARIAAAEQEYTFWHLVTPEYLTMHENGGNVPNEDLLIDMLEFASDQFMGSYPTPTYASLAGTH